MSFLHLSLTSQILGTKTDVNMLLPDGMEDRKVPEEGYQVVYLLHGYMGDYSDWIRNSLIENYTAGKQLVVVMPDGGKSFYTDMVAGDRYWTYLSEELPKQMSAYFKISERRCDHFAMGLSMGAYGALKLGLAHSDSFQAVAGFSGVVDVAKFWMRLKEEGNLIPFCTVLPDFEAIFGKMEQIRGTENDLYHLLEGVCREECPDIQLYCGTEDFLLEDNQRFYQRMADKKLPCSLEVFEGGHEWEFWGKALKKAFEVFPFRKY